MLYSDDNDDKNKKNKNNKFEPQKIILSISSKDSQILYKEFIDAIRSPETKSRYNYGLSKFLDFMELDRDNLDSLIKGDPKLIQKDLTNYIMYLRNKGLSYSTMSNMLAPLFFFFLSQ